MLRFRAPLAVALLVAPIAAHAQSGPAAPVLWRFVDPNAKAVIGIDWGRIRQSPAGTMIREQWISPGALRGFPGLELLDSIDRFLISSPGRDSSDGSDDDSGDSPILIAIQGHFDAAQVRQLFNRSGAKAQSYNSFQVYRPQDRRNRDTAYVLFDAATILYGDAPSVFATLDRNQFPQTAPRSESAGSMAARAAELDAKYEVWAIMDNTEITSSDPIGGLFHDNEWASVAQRIEAGFHLSAGLDADFTLRFSSEAAAQRVTTELTRAVSEAAKDPSADTLARNIARKLKFNIDGPTTKINLRLNERELEKTAQALAASGKASDRLAVNAVSNPAPAPEPVPVAAPSKPGVIRIEGLDEGTREIPFQDPEH
jgi:hypothetical protein